MSEVPLVQMYSNALFWANLRVGWYAATRGLGSEKVRKVIREESIDLRSMKRDEVAFRTGKPGLRAARFSLYEKRAEEERGTRDHSLYRL
ncbi:MAG: hypothetical protein WCI72_00560 [archaeon]